MADQKLDISGLDKAELLQALHANSKAQGLGFLHDRGELTVEECRLIIADRLNPVPAMMEGHLGTSRLFFDYLFGRVLKVDIGGDTLDPYMYDRDLGQGACAAVVESLRQKAG